MKAIEAIPVPPDYFGLKPLRICLLLTAIAIFHGTAPRCTLTDDQAKVLREFNRQHAPVSYMAAWQDKTCEENHRRDLAR